MPNYVEKTEKVFASLKDDVEFRNEIVYLIMSFVEYVEAVYEFVFRKYEIQNLSAEDYRIEFTKIDEKRHNCHESAIASLNALNRICVSLNIGLFADIDTSDRYAVADFVLVYVKQIYDAEIARTKGNCD